MGPLVGHEEADLADNLLHLRLRSNVAEKRPVSQIPILDQPHIVLFIVELQEAVLRSKFSAASSPKVNKPAAVSTNSNKIPAVPNPPKSPLAEAQMQFPEGSLKLSILS